MNLGEIVSISMAVHLLSNNSTLKHLRSTGYDVQYCTWLRLKLRSGNWVGGRHKEFGALLPKVSMDCELLTEYLSTQAPPAEKCREPSGTGGFTSAMKIKATPIQCRGLGLGKEWLR